MTAAHSTVSNLGQLMPANSVLGGNARSTLLRPVLVYISTHIAVKGADMQFGLQDHLQHRRCDLYQPGATPQGGERKKLLRAERPAYPPQGLVGHRHQSHTKASSNFTPYFFRNARNSS